MLPPPIQPGQTTIAVATPASPPSDLAAFKSGISYLTSKGFNVKTSRLSFPDKGFLSGTDEVRAAELNAFILDPEVDVIFCTRGGYGTSRILPLIDYDAARTLSKLLVGYSDITALQLALYHKAGWRSVSGPMVAVEWPKPDKASEQQFWRLVSGQPFSTLSNVDDRPFKPMRPGEAKGTLIGGNLTVLTRLIGTPYMPSLKGAILFIEDVNEPAYRVDALLSHLKLSGIWDNLAGLLIGQFTEKDSPSTTPPSIEAVFQDYCDNVSFPVASGLSYGHIPVKNSMPVGIQAHLTVTEDSATISILEPLVAPNKNQGEAEEATPPANPI